MKRFSKGPSYAVKIRIFLSASTMANLSAAKREDVAFKPPNHCYHSIIMTQIVHKVH
jgi:hypothetical protein